MTYPYDFIEYFTFLWLLYLAIIGSIYMKKHLKQHIKCIINKFGYKYSNTWAPLGADIWQAAESN